MGFPAQVNLPVGILIWVMIIPMLVKVDFGALGQIRRHVKGIGVTLFVNWLVKPFSMAFLGWLFIRHLFASLLPADQLDSYIAGLILLAAAPCTAMVFVWSRLTNGDPLFTLSQVALNDSIMVIAFAPLVWFWELQIDLWFTRFDNSSALSRRSLYRCFETSGSPSCVRESLLSAQCSAPYSHYSRESALIGGSKEWT